ncbi:hypothetical protein CYLTODRAFT_419767, partial [Cylindrobasidium torrendii FP15055 ss-10]
MITSSVRRVRRVPLPHRTQSTRHLATSALKRWNEFWEDAEQAEKEGFIAPPPKDHPWPTLWRARQVFDHHDAGVRCVLFPDAPRAKLSHNWTRPQETERGKALTLCLTEEAHILTYRYGLMLTFPFVPFMPVLGPPAPSILKPRVRRGVVDYTAGLMRRRNARLREHDLDAILREVLNSPGSATLSPQAEVVQDLLFLQRPGTMEHSLAAHHKADERIKGDSKWEQEVEGWELALRLLRKGLLDPRMAREEQLAVMKWSMSGPSPPSARQMFEKALSFTVRFGTHKL